ncbi:MAG: branched-chain amino acid transport system ATP-binding protein [Thermosediminibacterales bacterium]|nr:branched-chain amino acid transport system ATP-binding protein [Thermosediminibacterales bacterium]
MKLLEVKNATMRFGGLTAVSNFNLSLHKNEIVGLIGPNGAGKTTAFNMITGIYKPTEGEVYFKNNKISGLKPDKITQLGIARTFQNIRLFSELPVLDNVMIGMHLRLKSNFLNAILRTPGYLKEEKKHQKQIDTAFRYTGSL